MEESVREISRVLEKGGIVKGAYKAFTMLRPMAYRADLRRVMVLWMYGGLYPQSIIKCSSPCN